MVRLWRPALPLVAGLALAACGSRPEPTLADYSFGVSRLVGRLPGLFSEGSGSATGLLARGGEARALEELAATWQRTARPGGRAFIRLVDFRRQGDAEATAEVEIRLRSEAADEPGVRVATRAVFELGLERKGSASDADWGVRSARLLGGPPVVQRGRPHLAEEAAARGLGGLHEPLDPVERTNYCIPATHHRPGILVVDVDGDGAPDLVLPGRKPRLFLNDGTGHFHDATAGSGLDLLPDMEGSGGVAADLDGDGLPEIFLANHFSPSILLHNEGHGKFRDVTSEWGLGGLSGPFTAAVFFDADRDGRVDLFLGAYGDARLSGPDYDGFNGQTSRFFRNVERDGHPFFVDETESSGLGNTGWALAASACDFDDDGDDDLYVANDFGLHALYENRSTPGHPFFVNIARESGTLDDGYGMGVTWGDYDGDGRWDLHVSDYWTPYRWILRDSRWPMPSVLGAFIARPIMARKMSGRSTGDSLFRNLGGHRFVRTSEEAGVADGGWAWGSEFVDLDGKGREDLVVVNGMFQATTGVDDEVAFWNAMGREGIDFHDGIWRIDFGANGMASHTEKKLFWNRGDGTFEERAFVEGFDSLDDTRGLAYADVDGDGAPDLLVSCFRGPILLYHNGWTSSGRIRLLLSSHSGLNSNALGAVARLWAGGHVQLREVRAGSSYLSQSTRELLFGIGDLPKADRVEVRWPDGVRETLEDIPRNSRVVWTEGKRPLVLTGEAARGRLPG